MRETYEEREREREPVRREINYLYTESLSISLFYIDVPLRGGQRQTQPKRPHAREAMPANDFVLTASSVKSAFARASRAMFKFARLIA